MRDLPVVLPFRRVMSSTAAPEALATHATSAIDSPGDPAANPPQSAALHNDVALSLRNAGKLGVSLVGTWIVGLGVRIFLPRYFGPESFGEFQFADAITTTIFVATTLGVDTYVRKEVATRHEHASEFFAGTTLVRLALSVLILAVAAIGTRWGGKSADIMDLVIVLGAAQLLFNLNQTYAALLHATGRVDGLSVLNVGSKLAWAAGIAIGLWAGGTVHAVAWAMLTSEALRTLGLAVIARRAIDLRWRVDRAATRVVLLASLPFYASAVAQTLYARLDTSVMAFLTTDREVGWYGATQTLVGLSLVLTPLIGWVILPLTSRSAARSREELLFVGRRALEMVLALAFPITLLLSLNAELAIRTAFGGAYAPAARSLQIEAPMFVLTYAAMLVATLLVRLDRAWALTAVGLSGVVLSPVMNILLVPRTLAAFGPGGAGIGAAITLMTTEIVTTGALFWLVGRGSVDRRLLVCVAKTLGVCAVVAVVHRTLAATILRGGPVDAGAYVRLLVDAALYVVLIFASGAVRVDELRGLARGMMAARRSSGMDASPALATT